MGLFEQARYTDRAYQEAAEYSREAAHQKTEACLRIKGATKAECLREAKSAAHLDSHDKKREYDDLVAQRQSALWAMIVGICSVFGLFVSAGGMYLVWTTFEATRHANTIAHETARHELRAYLGTNSAWTRAGEEIWLFNLQNKGQTPASDVTIDTTLQIAGEPIQTDRYVYGQVDPGFTWVGTVASPRELAMFDIGGAARVIRRAMLDIVVRYSDIYDRKWVRTSRFEIHPQHKKFRETSPELWDFHLRDSYETEATE